MFQSKKALKLTIQVKVKQKGRRELVGGLINEVVLHFPRSFCAAKNVLKRFGSVQKIYQEFLRADSK